MRELNDVIASVDYCRSHDSCENCPCGLIYEDCDIDDHVLMYLNQLKLKLDWERKHFNPSNSHNKVKMCKNCGRIWDQDDQYCPDCGAIETVEK